MRDNSRNHLTQRHTADLWVLQDLGLVKVRKGWLRCMEGGRESLGVGLGEAKVEVEVLPGQLSQLGHSDLQLLQSL